MVEDSNFPDSYEQPGIVPLLQAIPRFGKPGLSTLLENPNDATIRAEYISGLTFLAVIVAIVVILWFLVICILKFIPKTGFLSGARFEQLSRHATPVRTVFLLAISGWIVCTILAYTEGIGHIQHSMETYEETSTGLGQLLTEADMITKNLEVIAGQSLAVREALVSKLGSFCVRGGWSIDTVIEETGFDLKGHVEQTIDDLENLGDFLNSNLGFVREDLVFMNDGKVQTDEAVKEASGQFNAVSATVLVFLILLPLFLSIGLFLAWVKGTSKLHVNSVLFLCFCYERFLQYAALPMLIIMTTFAVFIAGSFSMAAIANTDFCAGDANDATPSEGIQLLLGTLSADSDLGTDLGVLNAYITGECSIITEENDPFDFLEGFKAEIDLALADIEQFNPKNDKATSFVIQTVCGHDDYQDVLGLFGKMGMALEDLKFQLTYTQDLVDCKNISPIITHAVNNGICYYSLKGFASTFICFTAIALMGLVLITFRSSYLRSSGDDDYIDKSTMMVDDIIRSIPPPPRGSFASFRSSFSLKAEKNVDYGLPSHRPFITYDQS
mmetsp:Transcript_2530/g.3723  ORF Transcript_2530/g.3723 Transcript_2530/m.3723 type:complete len:555 (+) Transcript_2530:158-1822(+)